MKIYPYLTVLLSFLPNSFAMSPRTNPGCIRQNSDGIRTNMFLMHLVQGQVKLALELLDDEVCSNISSESLADTLKQAQSKHPIDINMVLNRFTQFKNAKFNQSPIPDLPD